MPTTQTLTTIPTATLIENAITPDEGWVQMPCCESVPGTFEATEAHVAYCWECQRNL